ncbi:nicotinamide/nicotinic acid mononucleotide adenylyltransferase 1-like [Misgurnus anguillicaudatus]|uniref:nicotinamide/nicotinic acid mononucleotide adenylyltransferase 1-like n=1 Tax=Misgurnus anguillicaudatus TaxID=75329 RepID=UPI003CCF543E
MTSQEEIKVVLLACGSFNPITNMHLRMFELARDHLEDSGKYRVVKGIISPVGDRYEKEGLIDASHRLKMARLAIQNSDWITVDEWECQQPEWVETAQVVRHHYEELISSENNNDDVDTVRVTPQLKLLCGADVLESFGVPNLWKPEDIEEIVGRYGVACITRCGGNPEKVINQSDVLYKHSKNIHVIREWVTNEVSATHMRRSLRRRQSVRYLLPDAVVNYIEENDLYSEESEQKNADVILAPQRYTCTN